MKARVFVTLKTGVLDPQGKAIGHALNSLGFGFAKHQVGKLQSGLHKTMFPYLREGLPTAIYACQTIWPLTIVATGPPRKETLSNGELRLLEKDLFTS